MSDSLWFQNVNNQASNLWFQGSRGGGAITGQPQDVTNALNYVKNPDMNQHQGMCEQFVEQVAGTPFANNAADAWTNYQQNGQAKADPSLTGVKPGDILYFSPNDSNQGNGHTGVYMGNNKFVSATDNGVEVYDLNDWNNLTGQTPLGYVPQGGSN